MGGPNNDTFNVSPSRYATILIDGGAPSFSQAGVPPGDTLNFNPLGNSITLTGNTIFTNGGSPAYQGVSFQDIESLPFTPLGTTTASYQMLGTATSPLQAGYTGILPTAAYTAALGYGWLGGLPASGGGFDRGAISSSPFANLIRGGQYGTSGTGGSRIFQANVADGYYMVSVKMGDLTNARPQMVVTNADTNQVVLPNVSTVSGQVAEQTFVIDVTDGTMDLNFSVQGTSAYWSVNGIDIRPAVLLSEGFAPAGPFTADGVSVDTVTASHVTPNAELTVTTSMGSIVSADVDPNIAGVQVMANALGQATIAVQRPSGTGQAVISMEEVSGAQTGLGLITYTLPTTRRFDFNAAGSPTQLPSSPPTVGGYFGVLPTQTYTANTGFGWVGTLPTGGFDRGVLSGTTYSNLLRDGSYGYLTGASTFRVDLPNGTYQVTVTQGDATVARDEMNVAVTVGSGAGLTNISSPLGQFVTNTFTATTSGGQLQLTFSDSGGEPYWVVNALEIRPVAAAVSVNPVSSSVGADGVTLDTVNVTGATPGAVYTLASSLGTITGVSDADTRYVGVQVVAPGSGNFSFQVQSPSATGVANVTVTEVTGASAGAASVTYTAAATRRYDFGTSTSPVASGFVQGLTTDALATKGEGWVNPAAITAYNTGSGGATTTTALYEDFDYANTVQTLQIQAAPSTTYSVRVYVGDSRINPNGSYSIQVRAYDSASTPPAFSSPIVTAPGGFMSFVVANIAVGASGKINLDIQATTAGKSWVLDGLDVWMGAPGGPNDPGAAPELATTVVKNSKAPLLTQAQLAPVVQEAKSLLLAAGLTSAQLAILNSVTFQIQNLDAQGELGVTDLGAKTIVLDDNGDGCGWFIDPTGTKVVPKNRYDLLTVVMHEMVHVLGVDDVNPSLDPNDLMTQTLSTGIRRMPTAADISGTVTANPTTTHH